MIHGPCNVKFHLLISYMNAFWRTNVHRQGVHHTSAGRPNFMLYCLSATKDEFTVVKKHSFLLQDPH